MNRKSFLSSIVAFGTAVPALGFINNDDESQRPLFIPKYLKPGDTIGITCPAGYITLQEIQPAMQQMENWGFKIRIGDTVGKKDFTFGGTDEERTKDFQKMLDDPSVKAIMCARGGYGAVLIVDNLKWEKFVLKPKWIIGC